jgi:DNA-binding Lrp family transcriptional regulator
LIEVCNKLILFQSVFVFGDFVLNACVLIRTSHGKFDDVAKLLRQLKSVKRIFPTLGRFDVVADVEAKDLEDLNCEVLRMGSFIGVVFTETLVEIQT